MYLRDSLEQPLVLPLPLRSSKQVTVVTMAWQGQGQCPDKSWLKYLPRVKKKWKIGQGIRWKTSHTDFRTAAKSRSCGLFYCPLKIMLNSRAYPLNSFWPFGVLCVLFF